MSDPSPPTLESRETADSQWFLKEVHPHEPALRSYLRQKFPWLGDVDDLVQESLLRLWRCAQRGRSGTGKGLLFTTARHVAIDLHRRRQSVIIDFVPDYNRIGPIDQQTDVTETVCRNQELELLAEAIAVLPTRCRQVLTLRKIYGYSQKEIGARLGISEHTVEVQIRNGMRRCVEFLRSRGVVGP